MATPRTAFAPGRVNLIGEHTDYNDGLALAFAISEGVTATTAPGAAGETCDPALARLLASELHRPALAVTVSGDVPRGGGLASSTALVVAVALALGAELGDPVALATACARAEHAWTGTRTGLLDQLASLGGQAGHAVRIDFATLELRAVTLELRGWRLAVADSGAPRALAVTGYGERRDEGERARVLLGLRSLRAAVPGDLARLPAPLDRRVRHVLTENARVEGVVAALHAGDLPAVGRALDASHASLRDDYASSTPAAESTVARLRAEGAAGARMMGGGFGGHVLALFAPGVALPENAREVTPSDGARLL